MASDDNYDEITSYNIEIQSSSGEWIPDTLTCDGSDPIILSTNQCWVPLTTLISSQYSLKQGQPIKVQVAAINSIGTSSFTQGDSV